MTFEIFRPIPPARRPIFDLDRALRLARETVGVAHVVDRLQIK